MHCKCCKECEKRTVGCHISCEDYAKFKKLRAEEQETYRHARYIEYSLEDRVNRARRYGLKWRAY